MNGWWPRGACLCRRDGGRWRASGRQAVQLLEETERQMAQIVRELAGTENKPRQIALSRGWRVSDL